MKRFMERTVAILASAAMAVGLFAAVPQGEALAASSGSQDMYRLYNPNSGEHFYTADVSEREGLIDRGWKYEGVGWVAPQSSDTPVYRLYNSNSGDHYYTKDPAEKDGLVRMGWNYEKVGWYSDDSRKVPLYQQYNPNARTGTHNYTTDKSENDGLARQGWRAEGIAWYAVYPNHPDDTEQCLGFAQKVTNENGHYYITIDQKKYRFADNAMIGKAVGDTIIAVDYDGKEHRMKDDQASLPDVNYIYIEYYYQYVPLSSNYANFFNSGYWGYNEDGLLLFDGHYWDTPWLIFNKQGEIELMRDYWNS